MENVGKPLARLYMITHQKEDSAVSVKLKDFQLRELKYNFVEKIVHHFHKWLLLIQLFFFKESTLCALISILTGSKNALCSFWMLQECWLSDSK